MQAPPNENLEFKSVGLTSELWSFVKHVGRGKYAYGIRYIVEQAYKVSAAQLPSHTGADSEGTEG
ncbi:MAG: hypothetical protein MUF28_07660 [Ignavibacterium sp.]|nr:hypothetical protein [Ignavibacterium sp.]